MKLYSALLIFLFSCPVLAAPSADELLWPQWRGPNRDGQVAGTAWPDDLSCLKSQWRVELGPGYPGPIVAQDRVFVAETQNEKTEVVRALDRKTGREIWRVEWTGSWEVPFFARANGSWIRSTPAYDGETLFVGGIREVLVALDAQTGKERWRVDFPALYGTKVPDFGFSSSPLLTEDSLFIQAANSIVKLNKNDGKVAWRSLVGNGSIGSSGAFSSPVLAKIQGKRQLIVQTRLELHSVDPQSGKVLWSQSVPNFRGMNILTPTIYGDSIFTSSYRNGSYLFSIQQEKTKWQVEELWQHKAHAYMSSPVVIDDHAYVHLGNNRLTCIDLQNGKERWTSKPFGNYWSQVYQGQKILALDENGELHLIRANTENLEILDSKQISDTPTWGHIAISDTQLFIRELEALVSYEWCSGGQPKIETAEKMAAEKSTR